MLILNSLKYQYWCWYLQYCNISVPVSPPPACWVTAVYTEDWTVDLILQVVADSTTFLHEFAYILGGICKYLGWNHNDLWYKWEISHKQTKVYQCELDFIWRCGSYRMQLHFYWTYITLVNLWVCEMHTPRQQFLRQLPPFSKKKKK